MDIFEEYGIVNSKIEELTVVKNKLRESILDRMRQENLSKKETSLGRFSISITKKWEYPERINLLKQSVDEVMDNLKAEMAKAQTTKEATYEPVEVLKYVSIKI